MSGSAAYNAGNSVGTVIAYLLLYGGIVALGIYFGNRLARKREGVFVRWPVGVAFAVALLLLIGQCSSEAAAQQVGTQGDIVVNQRSLGLASRFTSGFPPTELDEYDRGIRNGVSDSLKSHDLAISPGELSVNSTRISIGPTKLIQTKVSLPGRLFQFLFTGVSNGEALQVFCTSRTAHPFEPMAKGCEQHLKQIFGKKL